MCEDLKRKLTVAACVLAALCMALPASAASIGDFTLSTAITTQGGQQQFALTQVNPPSPLAAGVDVGMLVSYGTLGGFTGMFFEFVNRSDVPNDGSVLTRILFETDRLISDPSYVGWSGSQVSYTINDNVPGKPGGFQIEFAVEADPTKPGGYVNNGVGQGENLLLGFTIDPNDTIEYGSLLAGLVGGDWIIGAHLQRVSGIEPTTSIWLQAQPVPVPGAAGLGLLGLGLVGLVRRKKGVKAA